MATATRLPSAPPSPASAADAASPRLPRPAADRLALVLGLFFAGAGVMRLLPVGFDMALFDGWGLEPWFRTATGAAELAMGLLTVHPRTRPIGAVGIGTIMVSAGTVHAVLGHHVGVALALNGTLAGLGFLAAWTTRSRLPR